MEINDRIKALRKGSAKTQEQAAAAMACSRRQYIRYEKGEREIPASKLKTLCLFYNVSADYILGLPEGLNWPK